MISPYRRIVDPQNSLPNVSFGVERDWKFTDFYREKIDILADVAEGTKIGECDIITNRQLSHFDGVRLSTYWRGKRLGLATYLLAIERGAENGVPFETQDVHQSEDAKNIWLRLAQLGLAETIEPFRYYTTDDNGVNLYKGRYQVPLL